MAVGSLDIVPTTNPASTGQGANGAVGDIVDIHDGPDLLLVAPGEEVAGDGGGPPVTPPEGSTEIGTLDGYSDAVVYQAPDGDYYVMFNNAEGGPVTLNAEDVARLEERAGNGDEDAANYLESLGASDEELSSYGDPEEVTTGTTGEDHGSGGDGTEGPQANESERTRRPRDDDGAPGDVSAHEQGERVEEPEDDDGAPGEVSAHDQGDSVEEPDGDSTAVTDGGSGISDPEDQQFTYANGTTMHVFHREDGRTEYTVMKGGELYYQGDDAQEAMGTVQFHENVPGQPADVSDPATWTQTPPAVVGSDGPPVPSQVPVGTPRGVASDPGHQGPLPQTTPGVLDPNSSEYVPPEQRASQPGGTTSADRSVDPTSHGGPDDGGGEATRDPVQTAGASGDRRGDVLVSSNIVRDDKRTRSDSSDDTFTVSYTLSFDTFEEAQATANGAEGRGMTATAPVQDGNGNWVITETKEDLTTEQEAMGLVEEARLAVDPDGEAGVGVPAPASYPGHTTTANARERDNGAAGQMDGNWESFDPNVSEPSTSTDPLVGDSDGDYLVSSNTQYNPTEGRYETTTAMAYDSEHQAQRAAKNSGDPNALVRFNGGTGRYEVMATTFSNDSAGAVGQTANTAGWAWMSKDVDAGPAGGNAGDATAFIRVRASNADEMEASGWERTTSDPSSFVSGNGYSPTKLEFYDEQSGTWIEGTIYLDKEGKKHGWDDFFESSYRGPSAEDLVRGSSY